VYWIWGKRGGRTLISDKMNLKKFIVISTEITIKIAIMNSYAPNINIHKQKL
jgi:hypothetical protein